jgi:hypothetical protein
MRKENIITASILICFLILAGCSSKNEGLLLPSSAKQDSDNTLTIPFPYAESQNGQQWLLDRDASNNFIIKLINHGKELAGFPEKASKPERETVTITLGEQKYTITSVTLNSDNYSGYVTLKK